MNKIEHLLQLLSEEASEIGLAVSKIQRFGLYEVNVEKPEGPDNQARLVEELNDLLAILELLQENGVLPPKWSQPPLILEKKKRVRKWMQYSYKRGMIQC